ncbi:type II toxin-antitoxin system PrlF family antitoxin [Cronobacter sakazakii]|nr:type II toxin-antitoxin system PrlF family antitoxin [Cronobacter sakazakii]EKY3179849.1 type II toxin-antitoxin system PrlF family antitoxin [Cronobacter turicensis]EJV9559350.1 type II toxin-antitoxin system PrlF family antitoxin [Cronobacter sakazakii]EJV9563682.1 type II toxin-antitoxin system PrlF family antitoxin [Cronobacter sakazakii]EJX1223457.1 type II toxin-antitoxin system PrlF family antitoxin [Cronobacter sakazakii]
MATQMLNSADVSLRAESRLTERSQTTIPAAIRDALHLKPGEAIHYTLLAGGKVIMSKKEEEQDDPVVTQFLAFLENDMMKNPQNIAPVPALFWESIKSLTAGVKVDLDAPLTDD